MITKHQLEKSLPFNKDIGSWHKDMSHILEKYEINTANRMAGFLGQSAWESNSFTRLEENLNYSQAGLMSVFGKYFNNSIAELYARHPMQIANRVYANRMSNGDELTGDGWRYRGRGIIQLTGKYNYIKFSEWSGINVVDTPEQLAANKQYALLSAAWYWQRNNLNKFADNLDWTGMTRAINGGTHGLKGRIDKINMIKVVLCC